MTQLCKVGVAPKEKKEKEKEEEVSKRRTRSAKLKTFQSHEFKISVTTFQHFVPLYLTLSVSFSLFVLFLLSLSVSLSYLSFLSFFLCFFLFLPIFLSFSSFCISLFLLFPSLILSFYLCLSFFSLSLFTSLCRSKYFLNRYCFAQLTAKIQFYTLTIVSIGDVRSGWVFLSLLRIEFRQ